MSYGVVDLQLYHVNELRYMLDNIKPSSKSWMDQEAREHWSASKIHRTSLDSYLLTERGGLQRTDRAVTTCRLPPQPWERPGKC